MCRKCTLLPRSATPMRAILRAGMWRRGRPSLGQSRCMQVTVMTSRPVGPSLSEKTGKILTEFLRYYEDQYGVALFNSMRHEIEAPGGPQAQLLSRKVRGPGLMWLLVGL